MEITYQRHMDQNYMVLDCETVTGEEYALKMLQANELPHYLPLHGERFNGSLRLYYRITSLQPLSRIHEKIPMSRGSLQELFASLQEAVGEGRRYLLDPGDLILKPDCIYISLSDHRLRFCCLPGFGSSDQAGFGELSEFILKHLDHADRLAVSLGYGFYDRVRQDNFGFEEALDELMRMCRPDQDERSETGRESREGFVRSGGPGRASQCGMEAGRQAACADAAGHPDRPAGHGSSGGQPFRLLSDGDMEEPGSEAREEVRRRSLGIPEVSRRERRRGKSRISNRAAAAICVPAVALPTLLAYALGLTDLSQTGGLFFLLTAVSFLALSVRAKRQERRHNIWSDDEQTEDDEQEFLDALIADMYEQPGPETMTGGGAQRDALSQRSGAGEDSYPASEWPLAGSAPGAQTRSAPEGSTRMLTAAEEETSCWLESMDRLRAQDLPVRVQHALIGKMADHVDLLIRSDVVSRIHARIDQTEEGYDLTDLNSLNGTYLNGDRLQPNESRPIRDGDRIAFATLEYRFRCRCAGAAP